MPVVEPVVDEDKLRQLLDEGAESAQLDYKERLDLSQTRDRVELAKDAGAMLAEGGYIVVGADDTGKPTGTLTEVDASLFDESRLRSILRKWLPEPFEMLSRVHVIDGDRLALIYVGPHADGLCIFAADGQYQENSRSKTVFRQGDAFVRHGSSSERWTQQDIERFRRRITEQQRERWLEEIHPLIERIQRGRNARDLAASTPSALDYNLDIETFDEIVEQLIRANDYMPLRSYFLRADSEGQRLLADETPELEAFTRLHGRTASIVAAGIAYDQEKVVAEGVDILAQAYSLVGETVARRSGAVAARAWLDLIAIVESLGAFAVRRQNWSLVRALTLQDVTYPFHDDYWRVWLRHGLTMAARSNLLEGPQGDEFGAGLIARAHRVSVELPAMHLDVSSEGDRLLNSICQFDFLACLIAVCEFKSERGRDFYPSFSRYWPGRVEPVAHQLLTDQAMRQALVGNVTDEDLAAALDLIDRTAAGEGMRYSGWHGFSEAIRAWISARQFTPLSDQ